MTTIILLLYVIPFLGNMFFYHSILNDFKECVEKPFDAYIAYWILVAMPCIDIFAFIFIIYTYVCEILN